MSGQYVRRAFGGIGVGMGFGGLMAANDSLV